MKPGSTGWWLAKIRQTKRFFLARVTEREREDVVRWLSPAQLGLFDAMHVADRRHGLDVVAALRAGGSGDPEVLLAGLLHDAGKGDTGLVPRIVYSLATARLIWIERAFRSFPPMRRSLDRLGAHAETSALLAEAALCSPRTVELIRWQDDPQDPDAGERLRLADEAS